MYFCFGNKFDIILELSIIIYECQSYCLQWDSI